MKYKALLLIVLAAILLSACALSNESIATISFPELSEKVAENEYDISAKAKELDGERVQMVGYMSPLSPLDANFFYMIQVPGAACPFCDGADVDFLQVVQVYAPKNTKPDFVTKAIKVTGVLEVGEKIDENNVTSYFRLRAEKIE